MKVRKILVKKFDIQTKQILIVCVNNLLPFPGEENETDINEKECIKTYSKFETN